MTTLATLSSLANEINAVHERCISAAADAVTGAIEVGRLLSDAKAQLGHGEWSRWVDENCQFKMRQAQSYMTAFRNRDQLGANTQRASHLSLRGALKALESTEVSEPEPESKPAPSADDDEDHIRYLARNWWDDSACYVLMFTAAGWTPAAIAERLARPLGEVEAILNPQPPVRFNTAANGLALDCYTEDLADRYESQVAADIEGSLARAYEKAVRHCEADGFGEHKAALEAGHRRHQRRHDAIAARGELFDLIGQSDAMTVLWLCSTTDSRFAIRCAAGDDDDAAMGPLGAMFDQMMGLYRAAKAQSAPG